MQGSPAVLFPSHAFFETVTIINFLHLVIFRVPSTVVAGVSGWGGGGLGEEQLNRYDSFVLR